MIFTANPEKFERIRFSEEEREAAAYILYCMGRDIECGMDEQAAKVIRMMAEQNRELVTRAIAAAYMEVLDDQPNSLASIGVSEKFPFVTG